MDCMAARGNNGGGRRSKGPRRLVGSRLPIPQADKLADVAAHHGTTVSDYVADLLCRHLDTIDLSMIDDQETLPLDRAS